jgi:hypothetical protein
MEAVADFHPSLHSQHEEHITHLLTLYYPQNHHQVTRAAPSEEEYPTNAMVDAACATEAIFICLGFRVS